MAPALPLSRVTPGFGVNSVLHVMKDILLAVVGWLLYHPLLSGLLVLAVFVSVMRLIIFFSQGKDDEPKARHENHHDET